MYAPLGRDERGLFAFYGTSTQHTICRPQHGPRPLPRVAHHLLGPLCLWGSGRGAEEVPGMPRYQKASDSSRSVGPAEALLFCTGGSRDADKRPPHRIRSCL